MPAALDDVTAIRSVGCRIFMGVSILAVVSTGGGRPSQVVSRGDRHGSVHDMGKAFEIASLVLMVA
jgi:hypothetical protein